LDFVLLIAPQGATYPCPPQRGGLRFSNIYRPERATYSSPPQRGGIQRGGLRFNINKPSRSDIALSGRWILKIHDSHRVAVGWIILPRWGVGNFIVIRLI
jgi:hypothetical protein